MKRICTTDHSRTLPDGRTVRFFAGQPYDAAEYGIDAADQFFRPAKKEKGVTHDVGDSQKAS